MTWQQANVEAAAAYIRERIAAGASDARIKSVYEGLLDVLDPQRRTTRSQQESANAAKTTVGKAERDRRAAMERRSLRERRLVNLGARQGEERRRTPERRSGRDRRNR